MADTPDPDDDLARWREEARPDQAVDEDEDDVEGHVGEQTVRDARNYPA